MAGLGHAIGRALRETGQALERVGCRLQGNYTFQTFVARQLTAVNLFDKIPAVKPNSFVARNATILGDVTIGNSAIWYGAVIRGDVNTIRIGNNTSIGDNVTIHVASNYNLSEKAAPTIIEDNVVVEPGAIIHGCTLKNNSYVHVGAVISNNAIVGENSIVEAGAFVTDDTVIPSNQVWGGSPARFVRNLTAKDTEKYSSYALLQSELAAKHKDIQKDTETLPEDFNDNTFHFTPSSTRIQ